MALSDILSYYAGQLATITLANGYVNTVASVNQKPVNQLAEGSDKFPLLDVLPESENPDEMPGTRARVMKRDGVIIEGWVALRDDQRTAPWTPILSLCADVKAAILVDRACGGAAAGVVWPPRIEYLFGADEAGFQLHLQVRHSEAFP
jgi:hypothetical protein